MVDVSKAQDGGIIKKILTEGAGDTPSAGNEVSVHYTGRLLDGSVFDSSKDRDQLFKFKVGTGQVIKGWDEGIVTMKRGEVAILTCKPEYAYGASGSPPKIPPNSTLEFEVEMHDFYGEDCTESTDGGVLKSTTIEGTGLSNPREGATVTISWVMSHMDRELEKRSAEFILGDGDAHDIVPGIETALLKMKKGETAKVTVKSLYAYGNVGNAELAVPGAADLSYLLTLESFEQAKYKYEMDGGEKIKFAEQVKEMGTQYFKEGKYDLALKKYKLITDYLEEGDEFEGDSDSDSEEVKEEKKDLDKPDEDRAKVLMLAGFSNQAICHIKLGDGNAALKACKDALQLDPNNVKCLFRKGQAAEMSQEWEEAINHYKAVLVVDNKNVAAINAMKICTNKMKQFRASQKKRFANMFERTNFKEPEPEPEENKLKPDFSDSEGEEEEAVGSDQAEEMAV